MFYDKEGQEISLEEWASRFQDKEYQRIACAEMPEACVSTVWLGIDHGGGMIFETMVFGGELDEKQVRYRTLKEAKAGHKAIVEACRKLGAR